MRFGRGPDKKTKQRPKKSWRFYRHNHSGFGVVMTCVSTKWRIRRWNSPQLAVIKCFKFTWRKNSLTRPHTNSPHNRVDAATAPASRTLFFLLVFFSSRSSLRLSCVFIRCRILWFFDCWRKGIRSVCALSYDYKVVCGFRLILISDMKMPRVT